MPSSTLKCKLTNTIAVNQTMRVVGSANRPVVDRNKEGRHFIVPDNSMLELEGLTLKNGFIQGNHTNVVASHGGSILLFGSGKFTDVTFTENESVGGGALVIFNRGGGAFPSSIFLRCVFQENKAGSGGAVHVSGSLQRTTSNAAVFAESFFIDNEINGGQGKSIWLAGPGTVYLLNSDVLASDIEGVADAAGYRGTLVSSCTQQSGDFGNHGYFLTPQSYCASVLGRSECSASGTGTGARITCGGLCAASHYADQTSEPTFGEVSAIEGFSGLTDGYYAVSLWESTIVACSNGNKVLTFDRSSPAQAWPLSPDQTLSTPCQDVSVHGNTLAVGSGGGNNKVFLFQRADSSSMWPSTATTEITGYTTVTGFGHSVSISGTTLVVGAFSSSKAFIFERDSITGAFSREANKTISPGLSKFGRVFVDGNTIAIGTINGGANTVLVYSRANIDAKWIETTKIDGHTGVAGFGHALSVYGNTLVVGSENSNKVFVFERNVNSGTFPKSATTVIDRYTGYRRFGGGKGVSVWGNTIVVGAYLENRVFFFTRDSAQDPWPVVATRVLTASSLPGGSSGVSNFGIDVVVFDDSAVMSGYGAEDLYVVRKDSPCMACPIGKSNDGTGLTEASQCLSAPSSLEVRVLANDELSINIGPADNSKGAAATHYNITVQGGFKAPLEVYQNIPTQGASGWKAFSIGDRQMLAVANAYDGSTRVIESVIYEWSAASSKFEPFQRVPTQAALQWEAFSMHGRQMLAVANSRGPSTHVIESVIYEWSTVSNTFEVLQRVLTNGAKGWKAFSVSGRQMLAVANYYDGITHKVESVIYEYQAATNTFEVFQRVPTQGACGWEAFSVGRRQMLAVANHYNDITTRINSIIYEWSVATGEFEEFQYVPTIGTLGWEAFSIGGRQMLAVANQYDNSMIYEWSPASNKFEEFQNMHTQGAYEWKAFSMGERQLLAVANSYSGSTSEIESVIYEYQAATDNFEVFQSVHTQGARGWEAFSMGGRLMLVVANHLNDDSLYKIDSAIIVSQPKEVSISTTAANIPITDAVTTLYTVAVVACNSLGCSTTSASDATGVPSAPSSLEVHVAGDDQLSLRIGYPNDDGGANVTHYITHLSPKKWNGIDLASLGSTTACAISDDGALHVHKGACSLNKPVTWNFEDRQLIFEFETRGCHESGCNSVYKGASNRIRDQGPHWYFEPFRTTLTGHARQTPDLWWISRVSDYGFGFFDFANRLSTELPGSGPGRSMDTSTDTDPTQYHAWKVAFSTKGNCVHLDEWTVDGISVGFGSTDSNNVSYCTAYGTTTYVGFGAYPDVTHAYVRNFKMFSRRSILSKELPLTITVPNAATQAHDAGVYSCNSLGCGTISISDSTAPPCHPPHAYLREHNLCWACPPRAFSKSTNDTKCVYRVIVPPNSLAIPGIIVKGMPDGPSIKVTGIVPRNISNYGSNTTFARITLFHEITQTTASFFSSSYSEGDRVLSTTDSPLYVTPPPLPLVFSDWSFNTTLDLSALGNIGDYVGTIPLTLSVQACVGLIKNQNCGIPTTIMTPLANNVPPPTLTSVQPASVGGFNLIITWEPSMFKGPLVPLNTTHALFTIEEEELIRVGEVDVEGGKLISNRNRSFQVANTTTWTTPNGLLGSQLAMYRYRVRAQYPGVDGNLGNTTAFSSTLSSSVRSQARAPTLRTIIPQPLDQGGDQVPTEKNGELAFNVRADVWTGTPIFNYTLRWDVQHNCGEEATKLDGPWSSVPGPGRLDAAASEKSSKFTVLVPDSKLIPDTTYHIEVNAAVPLSGEALLEGRSATDDDLKKSDHVLVILETLLGPGSINISNSAGDDAQCKNVTLNSTTATAACKTIAFAMNEFRYESFVYLIKPGNYTINAPMTFEVKHLQVLSSDGLVEHGALEPTVVKCASRCLEVDATRKKTLYAPKLVRGMHFVSSSDRIKQPSAHTYEGGAVFMSDLPSTGLAPGSEYFDITIEACRFSGFAALHGGAIYVVNVRARLKIAGSFFNLNTAIDGQGGAVSIDTSTDVVLDRVHCEENRANHNLNKFGHGGCLSVTSNAEEGLPSSVLVNALTSRDDQAAQYGGAVYVGRSSTMTMTRSSVRGAKGSSAVYLSSAKVTLSTLSVENTACASDDDGAVTCVASALKLNKNSNVTGTLGRGLKSTGCSLVMRDTRIAHNAARANGAAVLLISKSDLEVTRSVFASNTAGGDGGAVACEECMSFSLRDSTFDGNVAARGGALYLRDLPTDSIIQATRFEKNTAKRGGGGAIYQSGPTFPSIDTRSVFFENLAKYGDETATDPINALVRLGDADDTSPLNHADDNTTTTTKPRPVLNVSNSIRAPAILVSVLDRFGAVVKDEVTPVKVVVSSSNASFAPLSSERRSLEEFVLSSSGDATFNTLILRAYPGEYVLTFTAQVSREVFNKTLSVVVQECIKGQSLDRLEDQGYMCRDCAAGMRGYGNACTECLPGMFSPTKSSVVCQRCPAGYSQPLSGKSSCTMCVEGRYSDTVETCASCTPGFYSKANSSKCSTCLPGQSQPNPGQKECIECEAGRYSAAPGATTCEECAVRTKSKTGSTNCTMCTLGKVQQANNRRHCYLCRDGTFSLDPGSESDGTNFDDVTTGAEVADCQECKDGATCKMGLIMAKNGWWRPDPKTNTSFFKCKTPKACLGAANPQLDPKIIVGGNSLFDTAFNESCADGYVGRLCHRCRPGWSRDGLDVCKACLFDANSSGALWFAGLGVLLVFCVFAAFIRQSMTTKLQDPTSASITMKIAASHMQIIAIAANLPFRWPEVVKALFRAFDAISSVSEDVINLECVYAAEGDRGDEDSVVYQTTLLILLGPFFFVLVATLFWSLAHCWNVRKFSSKLGKHACEEGAEESPEGVTVTTWKKTRQKIIVSVIVVMVLIHPTLTRRSVQLLTCDQLGTGDPRRYLRRDLQIVCWKSSHLAWALTIGIPFLILYALGIPIVSLYVMFKRKHKLHKDLATVSRFGFLYLGYAEHAWYWEAIGAFSYRIVILLVAVTVAASAAATGGVVVVFFVFFCLPTFWSFFLFNYHYGWISHPKYIPLLFPQSCSAKSAW